MYPYEFLSSSMKDYFGKWVHTHLDGNEKNKELIQSLPALRTLSKLCNGLGIVPSPLCHHYLLKKLITLHLQLKSSLKNNGYEGVLEFVKMTRKIQHK